MTDQLSATTTATTQKLESGDDLAAKALAAASAAELPATTSSPTKPKGAELAETLTSLQHVIERNAMELDRLKNELKEARESMKNVAENDTELAEAEEKANVFMQQMKERKAKLQTSPQVVQLKTKIGELNEQKKEVEEALNNHLLNLFQITGTKTFDTSSGEQREFSVRASLKSGKPAA